MRRLPPRRGELEIARKALLKGLAFASALLFATTASAARPLDTEDTGTAERVELELGVDQASDRSWAFTGVVNVGVLSNLELSVQGQEGLDDPDESGPLGGVGDSVLGLKYRFLDEADSYPALLGRLTLRLPTGSESRGFGDDGVDLGVLLAASKQFGSLTVTGNVGYTFVIEGGDLDFVTLAASLEWPIPETTWTVVGELVGRVAVGQDADDTLVIRGGVRYQLLTGDPRRVAIIRSATLDAAVGFGLTSASPDVVATVGLTLGF